jgi:4-amino-4-deoxychorismate lyase
VTLSVSPDELFGDGVFETIHLRPAGPFLLPAHLARLAGSAALLDIAVPEITVDARGSDGAEEALRIICTRRSHRVTVSPIPPETLRERREGVRVVSAGLGFAIGGKPPWSLWGAKTLSYAENFAARRWARARGADDLLWLSTEGYALEAPTSSLVWLAGSDLCTVPYAEAQILPGTTAGHLLSLAPSVSLRPCHRMVTIDQLRGADAIWLASALRGLAFVTELDGVPRRRSRWTPILLDLLGY